MASDLHRRFGVEANNETWRLLVAGEPGPAATDDERARLLYRAYASAYHWMETPAGTPANHARGEHLIARAAIAVGLGEVALRHAHRCLGICEAHPEVVEDWDVAFAHEAIARAHAAMGDVDTATDLLATAARLGAGIADDEDRGVFLQELARGPWFGIDSADA